MNYRPLLIDVQGCLVADSAFRSGTGQRWSPMTDSPLARVNGKLQGQPIIPGASLKGVIRAFLKSQCAVMGCRTGTVDNLFGSAAGKASVQSRVVLWDAVAKTTKGAELRDHVQIDPITGAAAYGAKFDEEAGAPETTFFFRCQYEGDAGDTDELLLLQEALRALQAGELRFGSGASRGYGRLRLNEVRTRAWQRNTVGGLASHLRARLGVTDPEQEPFQWPPVSAVSRSGLVTAGADRWDRLTLDLRIECEGPVLVKSAVPPVADIHDGEFAKHEFVRYGGKPCLPGSSLRGWFRSRALQIVNTTGQHGAAFERLFGSVRNKSLLSVEDGSLELPTDGSVAFVALDHIAVDRITNFPASGKIFGARALASPVFKSLVELRYRSSDQNALTLWEMVLRDAVEGYRMWIGSGTTRGYGKVARTVVTRRETGIAGKTERECI